MDAWLTIDSCDRHSKSWMDEWAQCGVQAWCADSVQQALSWIENGEEFLFVSIDAAVCPDYEGVLPTIRNATSVPICVIADNYSEGKMAKALCSGADIYIPREYDLGMHFAVKLMKLYAARAAHSSKPPVLVGGDIVISRLRRDVFVHGTRVSLTKKEFDVLYCLMSREGEVVLHEPLLKEVWGPLYGEEDIGVLWRTVNRLRDKLSKYSITPNCVVVERGVGYRFAP